MKEERIMDALGSIKDKYVMEAAPAARKTKKHRTGWIAAVLALILGAALFTRTAPGTAAAAFVKEQVVSLIETLFPPKEITAMPEGMPEEKTYTAGGQEPRQDESAAKSGFAIYYDPDSYEMTEEHGVTYIRSIPVVPTREEIRANNLALLEGLTPEDAEKKIDELLAQQEAFYASLPKCELEILHVPDTAPDETATAVRREKQQHWESVSEIEPYEPLACIAFYVSAGTTWDSPVEHLYFVGNKQTGTYQITLRYFVEATEGHGVRLMTILNTFEVISPQ